MQRLAELVEAGVDPVNALAVVAIERLDQRLDRLEIRDCARRCFLHTFHLTEIRRLRAVKEDRQAAPEHLEALGNRLAVNVWIAEREILKALLQAEELNLRLRQEPDVDLAFLLD